MKPRPNHHATWLISITLLVAFFIASLLIGGSQTKLTDFWDAFYTLQSGGSLTEESQTAWTILTELRLPRAITAALVGAALAIAGVLAQGIFRENLASPTVLGTEAGGSMAAALAFIYGIAHAAPIILPAAAFVGAVGTTLLTVAIAQRGNSPGSMNNSTSTMMLSGFAINALLGAGTSYLMTMTLEEPGRSGKAISFLIGGFSAKGFEHATLAAATLVAGVILALRVASSLDILSLGEDTAQSLSINMSSLRRQTVAVVGLLVAGAVAVAGALPFVGLIVPHIARRLIGPSHRQLVVLAGIQGAILLLAADLTARCARAPIELPASILTSVLGASFFLVLLMHQNQGDRS